MKKVILAVLLALATLSIQAQQTAPAQGSDQPFDLVIRNGRIIDGTGSPWYSGDIGIRQGKIATIGNLASAPAKRTIDAAGRVVAPGFIDMLGQSDLTILVDPKLPSKIYQGITTEITGEGGSAAPLNDRIITADKQNYEHLGVTPTWKELEEYFARLEKQGIGINFATYVGATQVRRMVVAEENRAPSPAELEQMKQLVRTAMQQGAMGVSTSLQYAPAPYASTEELIALAGEGCKAGGIYATHMRNEGSGVMTAIEEVIRIAKEAKCPIEIWHIKAAGKPNWGRMTEIVQRINQVRNEGVDIAADTYAYTAWFNSFSAFIPPWAHDGGDQKLVQRLKNPADRARIRKELLTPSHTWDNEWQEIPGPEAILISGVHNPALKPLVGKNLAEIAKQQGKDPINAMMDILVADNAFTYCAVFGMSEPDVVLALQQPWVSVDNDSEGTSPEGRLGEEHPHPRAYGTFPRIIHRYVKQQGKLTLPDAIRKFTSLAAQRMRITDRGVLKQGMWADIVIFDPNKVRDLATFENPNQLSAGMDYVLVNGVPVIDSGKMTNALPGKVLRGPGYQLLLKAGK
jgi:dihydroorotase/N-acyl-D-amino-acid deacylase